MRSLAMTLIGLAEGRGVVCRVPQPNRWLEIAQAKPIFCIRPSTDCCFKNIVPAEHVDLRGGNTGVLQLLFKIFQVIWIIADKIMP